MTLVPKPATSTGDPAIFVGEVWIDTITNEKSRARVARVRFAPGARNAWHAHVNGQTLHVLDGIGLVQSRGEAITVVRPGDTIWAEPGEWHWHGAAPGHFMTHLAIMEALAAGQDGPETRWGDQVTDDEYRAAPAP